MWMSDIQLLDNKSTDEMAKMKGYRRYVLCTRNEYGVEVGDFNSKVRFGFVLHKPARFNDGQVKVELKVMAPAGGEFGAFRPKTIDPNLIKRLMAGAGVEFSWTYEIEDGVGFFKGQNFKTTQCRTQNVLASTMAARFIDVWGHELATILAKKGTGVDDLLNARYVNTMLRKLIDFSKEMKDEPMWGSQTYNIGKARESMNDAKKEIEVMEQEMNKYHESLQEAQDALAKFGVSEDEIDFR